MILETRVVYDQEYDNHVFCVRFDGDPSTQDLKEAFKKAPHPWGTAERPQAFPSFYVKAPNWYDVGNADGATKGDYR